MSEPIAHIPFATLEAFMKDVFVAIGVPEEDAAVCADVLIESDKRGIDSHGISRFKPIYIDRIKEGIQKPVTKFDIVKDSMATAVVDGNHGMGQVIAKRAMQMAIDKAKVYGIGMVAARNSTHYGIAGYYASMACKEGMIGITGTNARPSVAPTFGVENMLGTNPLTFGMPSDEPFDFVLDCATSLTQRGKIELYARKKTPMPEGWVVNQDGGTETDAEKALNDLVAGAAALAPLGGIGEDGAGYKGYGYATAIEILSAALQGGNFLKMLNGINANGEKVPYGLGHFFIAINIESFIELDSFKHTTGEILRALRASKKAKDRERIYTAGEKEYLAYEERKITGVPINESLKKDMLTLREAFAIAEYDFPF